MFAALILHARRCRQSVTSYIRRAPLLRYFRLCLLRAMSFAAEAERAAMRQMAGAAHLLFRRRHGHRRLLRRAVFSCLPR